MRPASGTPCRECPWRRTSAPGFTGPHTADEWADMAHGEAEIACHLSIPEGFDDEADPLLVDELTEDMRQCSGVAIYRANVCKSPRDPFIRVLPPNAEAVFNRRPQFVEHHARVKVRPR